MAGPVGQRALAVREEAGQLGQMLPPPPRAPKRKQEVVLDEDNWSAQMEAIIERDFFPELGKLQSKVEWLQAVRSGDPAQIRAAQLAIAQRRAAAGGRPMTGATPANAPLFTPGGTAARLVAGDTPYIPSLPTGRPATSGGGGGGGGTAAGPSSSGGVAAAVPPMSLDTFLAQHTSEDNASFQEILEEVNKRRRLKYMDRLAPRDPRLLLTAGAERTDGFGTGGQAPDTLLTWKFEPKNVLFYGHKDRATVPYSEAERAAMVQGPPKEINHAATRFGRGTAAGAAAAGSEPPTPSASGGSGGAAAVEAAAAAAGGGGGYDILATPSFDPGADASPFVTWGDIEATPLRIEAEDLPPGPLTEGGRSFRINEVPVKDQRARELSAKASASMRHAKGTRGSTPLVTGLRAATAAAGRRLPTGSAMGGSRLATGAGGTAAAGAPQLSAAAQRLKSSLHRGRRPDTEWGDGLRASYKAPTPATRCPASGKAPSAGSGWNSAAPTPSRGWTPAVSPAVHAAAVAAAAAAAGAECAAAATLAEEELRMEALRQVGAKDAAQQAELEAARAAARDAFQKHGGGGDDASRGGDGGAGNAADLTAGLLNI